MDTSSTAAPRPRRRPRVLLVNEAAAERDLFSAYLSRAGFDVQVAASGLEALARAVARRRNAIVRDSGAAPLDRWDAARRLRAAVATRDIPVIAMSAAGSA